jgi:dihydroflavonol-4-reductase
MNVKKYQRVLVTGSTGFLGAYVVQALVQAGHEVFALRRPTAQTPDFIPSEIWSSVHWLPGDLLDIPALEDAMENIDAIVHAAALVSFRVQDRDALYQVNQTGTANLVNVALEKNVTRFIYISSVAALGRTADGQEVDEKKEWVDSTVNTQYAISKHKAELEVWRGGAEGLSTVILNPSTILGYGNWNESSCAIFKNVFHEFPYYTHGINGFVGVEDVAKITVTMLESDIENERFIVNADNWPFQKLLSTIAHAMGKKAPTKLATPFLASIAWRWEAIKCLFTQNKPLLTKESARVAHSKTHFNNQKLLKTIPHFSYTPLTEVILESAKSYLKKHHR